MIFAKIRAKSIAGIIVNHSPKVKGIVWKNFDIELKGDQGRANLYWAAEAKSSIVVEMLKSRGARY